MKIQEAITQIVDNQNLYARPISWKRKGKGVYPFKVNKNRSELCEGPYCFDSIATLSVEEICGEWEVVSFEELFIEKKQLK